MILDANNKNIHKAINLLSKGEIIIYPTDTLYGIGVDATNTNAIEKLNILKNRNSPLSIIVSSFKMMKKYAEINNNQLIIIKKLLICAFRYIIRN